MDLITVITPAYKAQDTIIDTVRSVIDQTYKNWEQIIISDDGFDYAEFLRANGIDDARIKFLTTGRIGSGPSFARNIAIRNSRSDFIALLDSDDLFAPRKLEIVVPMVKKYYFVSSAMVIKNFAGEEILTVGDVGDDRVIETHEYKRINCSGDNMLVFDRSKITNFYNEDCKYLEDLQFVLAAFENVGQVFHFSQILHYYLKTPHSLSNDTDSGEKFIQIKKQIISNLDNNKYQFVDPKTKDAILEFLEISKKSEEEFVIARKIKTELIFEEILINKLENYL